MVAYHLEQSIESDHWNRSLVDVPVDIIEMKKPNDDQTKGYSEGNEGKGAARSGEQKRQVAHTNPGDGYVMDICRQFVGSRATCTCMYRFHVAICSTLCSRSIANIRCCNSVYSHGISAHLGMSMAMISS
jgi:hypothetical protein